VKEILIGIPCKAANTTQNYVIN